MKLVSKVFILSVAFLVLSTAKVTAQGEQLSIEEISALARGSIVFLTVEHVDPNNLDNVCSEVNQGTAFLISNNGYALTANHNLLPHESCEGFTKLQIKGEIGGYLDVSIPLPAHLIGRDDLSDTAIIKFTQQGRSYGQASFCNIGEPLAGETLVAFGFPIGVGFAPLEVRYSSSNGESGKWVVSSDFTYGMSGGPVYNLQGNVVGIVQGGLANTSAVRFVVPLRYASNMIDLSGQDLLSCTDVTTLKALETEVETLKAKVASLEDNSVEIYSKAQGQGENPWSWTIETNEGGYRLVSDLELDIQISKTPCILILSANGHTAPVPLDLMVKESQTPRGAYFSFFVDGESVSNKNELYTDEPWGGFGTYVAHTLPKPVKEGNNWPYEWHPLAFTQMVRVDEVSGEGTSHVELRIFLRKESIENNDTTWFVNGTAIQVVALGCSANSRKETFLF